MLVLKGMKTAYRVKDLLVLRGERTVVACHGRRDGLVVAFGLTMSRGLLLVMLKQAGVLIEGEVAYLACCHCRGPVEKAGNTELVPLVQTAGKLVMSKHTDGEVIVEVK